MTTKIIIDTDPGIDDAIAIWLALASPELEILGITAVSGNGPVEGCARNAVRILDAAGRPDIPVHAGAAQPLARPHGRKGWGIHGADGLGGIGLPPPSRAVDGNDAVSWLARTLEEAPPGSVTLLPIGPLTNIARLLQSHPLARRGIARMVVMGGAASPRGGNATPHAEYNFWIDPEAADIACRSGVPITLVTMETALPVQATPDRIRRLEAAGSAIATHAASLLRVYVHGARADSLFDPLVVLSLLEPGMFGQVPARFSVVHGPSERAGALDWQPGPADSPHVLLQTPDPDDVFDRLAARFRQRP